MSEHIAPQNLDAEAAVLGGVLIDNTALARVTATLQPADFYRHSHGKIFAAMIDLEDRQQPVDLITLSDLLKVRGELEAVGGTAYLAELHEQTPTAANIVHHARLVKDAGLRRSILHALSEARDAIHSRDKLEDTISRLISIFAASNSDAERDFHGIDQVLVETIKHIQKSAESANGITGIPTGLSLIDESMGGLPRGGLIVIGGRPGMGKTAIGGTIAVNAAERGYPVAFVTAESPNREIVQRILSAHTSIENRNLRRGKLRDCDYAKIVSSSGTLSRLPMAFLDGYRNWDVIKAKIRALIQKQHISLIVCDYAQLLSAPMPNRERYLEVGRISAEAKNLAVELDAAFVLLAQLNREVENRSDKRPQLSDLRESGNLEQDADIVGLLYRPWKYDASERKDLAELNIEKHRNGAVGHIPLRFTEETTWFSDWTD